MLIIIGKFLLTTAVIFGGRKIIQRWLHKRRMAKNDRHKKMKEQAWKRRFALSMREIEQSWKVKEPPMQKCTIKGREVIELPKNDKLPRPLYLNA